MQVTKCNVSHQALELGGFASKQVRVDTQSGEDSLITGTEYGLLCVKRQEHGFQQDVNVTHVISPTQISTPKKLKSHKQSAACKAVTLLRFSWSIQCKIICNYGIYSMGILI